MADPPLLEERYAPDQYKILVTCIFLNKTKASQADPQLKAFLVEYPTSASLQNAEYQDIEAYFKTLGLRRRAKWLMDMAKKLENDPPQTNVLRYKTYNNGKNKHLSEVAHLPGVGEYASDAWRLFCKVPFYAEHGIVIPEEWRTLEPADKDLKRYVKRLRGEEASRLQDSVIAKMEAMHLSNDRSEASKELVTLKSGFAVPRRILAAARPMSV